jgi:transcriptional regulator with XRE-family HTH domain
MAGMEQDKLANEAGVTAATISRLEAMPGRLRAHKLTVLSLQRALEAAGIVFVNDRQPGVRMRELPA